MSDPYECSGRVLDENSTFAGISRFEANVMMVGEQTLRGAGCHSEQLARRIECSGHTCLRYHGAGKSRTRAEAVSADEEGSGQRAF